MSDPRERAAERAQKLLRTAAPSSGASENERTTAALHAADLIEKHELTIVAAEPEQDRKTRERAEKRSRQRSAKDWAQSVVDEIFQRATREAFSPDWHEVVAQTACVCGQCRGPIEAGEPCWYAEGRGHIHHDITCSINR